MLTAGAQRFNALADDIDPAGDAPFALARLTGRLWTEAAHVQVAAAIALDERHVADTAAALAPLRRRVAAIVAAGQEAGTLRTDIAAPTLARLIEETARVVVTQVDASSPEARSIAIRAVLSIAGLSWREADAVVVREREQS